MKIGVSAIVPAYNEEKNIFRLLDTLIRSPYLQEVICINDGSTDNTLNIIKKIKGVIIINFKKNRGKAYAVAHGIRKARGQIVMFLDADLIGLDDRSIKKLIKPLEEGKFNAAIGYPYCNHFDELFQPLSGERAYFRKDLVPHLKQLEKKGYGLELYLNHLFRNKKVKSFPLKGVKHTLKHKKQSFDIAAKMTLIEGFDIFSEIMKQNNPISYLIRSYLYHFYLTKPDKLDWQINRLTTYIKKKLLIKLF